MPLPLLVPLALAAGGALAGGISSATKKKPRVMQSPTMSTGQIQDSDFMRQFGRNKMENPYAGFDPIAQRAQTQFNQQTVPSLAERFTSMGSGSALSSPAFASQLGQAGQGLSENLSAMMSEYGLQNEQQGMQAMGQGMRPQFENSYMPESQGFMSGMFGGLGSGLSSMASGGLGQFMQQGGKGGMFGHGGFATKPSMPYAQRHPTIGQGSSNSDFISELLQRLQGGN